MSFLAMSHQCRLFEEIADKVWKRICRKHSLGLNDKEEGITNDIIADIVEYHQNNYIDNFDVYARAGYKESITGSDIDLFVETEIDQYIWYPLQAKLLKKDRKYYSFFYPQKEKQQWELLTDLESFGAIPYYLFYNGVDNFSYNGRDKCLREYNEKQLGCSIVKPLTVKNVYENKKLPEFKDFHTAHSQSWRILVCCHNHSQTKFSLQEIEDSSIYLKLEKLGEERKEINEEIFQNENKIISACEKTNWKPDYRIIVKRTYR